MPHYLGRRRHSLPKANSPIRVEVQTTPARVFGLDKEVQDLCCTSGNSWCFCFDVSHFCQEASKLRRRRGQVANYGRVHYRALRGDRQENKTSISLLPRRLVLLPLHTSVVLTECYIGSDEGHTTRIKIQQGKLNKAHDLRNRLSEHLDNLETSRRRSKLPILHSNRREC